MTEPFRSANQAKPAIRAIPAKNVAPRDIIMTHRGPAEVLVTMKIDSGTGPELSFEVERDAPVGEDTPIWIVDDEEVPSPEFYDAVRLVEAAYAVLNRVKTMGEWIGAEMLDDIEFVMEQIQAKGWTSE